MFFCNQCGSSLRDDLRLCPECGAQNFSGSMPVGPSPERFSTEPVLSLNPTVPIANARGADQSDIPTASPLPASVSPRSSSTMLIVAGTAIVTLLVVALGIVVARPWLRGDEEVGSKTFAPGQAAPSIEASTAPQPSGTTATPQRMQPIAKPSINTAELKQEVFGTLDGWAAASRAHDLDAHMSYYAQTLDTYYKRYNVGVDFVRADRARAYNRYYKLDIQLSNVEITIDPSGERATAVLDKAFSFEGDKYLSGKVREMVWLAKISGRWLITGEKDVQVYYVNR